MRAHSRSLFFFNDTATTEIYTLSLHDALPIYRTMRRSCGCKSADNLRGEQRRNRGDWYDVGGAAHVVPISAVPPLFRSEEHTSELQSHLNLVCRLLLEKKNTRYQTHNRHPWTL